MIHYGMIDVEGALKLDRVGYKFLWAPWDTTLYKDPLPPSP